MHSDRIWVQYQYGNLYYSGNGGEGWTRALNGVSSSDRKNWNCPLVQDPTDPDRRFFGTNRVYESLDVTSWTAISGDLTAGPHQNNRGQVMGTLTTLAVSSVDNQVIWAGSDDGHVSVTQNSGGTWTIVSGSLPERWITSVRCDPQHRETAYVTLSGFRWAEPLPHVFRTTDLGETWSAIAGNVPEAPANDIVVDPHYSGRLYLATDVGVFGTADGGQSWTALGSGLPRVVVNALAFDPANRRLFAATYGRSLYSLDLGVTTSIPADWATGPEESGEGPSRGTTKPLLLGRTLAPYPNPTGGGTRIRWEITRALPVRVDVFTISGRRVFSRTINASAGLGQFEWEGRDIRGRTIPSGVYLLTVSSEGKLLGSQTVVIKR
jgi:hypothetical protein